MLQYQNDAIAIITIHKTNNNNKATSKQLHSGKYNNNNIIILYRNFVPYLIHIMDFTIGQ